MKIKFYQSLSVLFIILISFPANAQTSLQWEKPFKVSQIGASAVMLTDDSLNSYFIGVKEDTSFFYKLDSNGAIKIRQPFAEPFMFTSAAKKLKGNPNQFVFFGSTLTKTSYYKFDLSGNKLAETVLNNVDEINDFDLDASGNVYLVSSGINTFYITKVNSPGGIAWQKLYNDPNTDNEMEARIKCGLNNDIYFVYDAGSAKNQSIVNPIVSYSALDGSPRWKSFIHNSGSTESTLDKPVIIVDGSGNVICAAAIYDTLSGTEKAIICKFNYASGSAIFRIEDTSKLIMNSHSNIVVTIDNKIIIAGNNSISFGSMLKCYTLSGLYLWTRNIPDRSTLGNRMNFIYSPEKNKLYYATGTLFGVTDTVRFFGLSTSNSLETLMVYSHRSTLAPKFTGTSILIGTISIVKGNIFILGNAAETIGAFGFSPSEPFLLRYNYSSVSGIKKNKTERISIRVYPNPVKDELKLSGYSLSVEKNANYAVLNLTGQTLLTGTLIENETILNVALLSSGVYMVKTGNILSRFVKE